jgi:hypothetical protein
MLNARCKSRTGVRLSRSPTVRRTQSQSHDRRPVGQCVLVSSPIWGSWSDINYYAKENTAAPLFPRDRPQRKRFHCCVVVHCSVFIRCHSNGCQHMPYCLQHARHNMLVSVYTQLYSISLALFILHCQLISLFLFPQWVVLSLLLTLTLSVLSFTSHSNFTQRFLLALFQFCLHAVFICLECGLCP